MVPTYLLEKKTLCQVKRQSKLSSLDVLRKVSILAHFVFNDVFKHFSVIITTKVVYDFRK